MKKEPIYLDNFELALKMQEAGFNKECVHRAFIADSAYFDAINIFAYDKIKERRSYKGEGFGDGLNLPTLGEIELPEGVSIEKEEGEYYVFDNCTGYQIGTRYKTELEARCHAWLWANKKKEVGNE